MGVTTRNKGKRVVSEVQSAHLEKARIAAAQSRRINQKANLERQLESVTKKIEEVDATQRQQVNEEAERAGRRS